MSHKIIDTNVIKVASGTAPQASVACRLAAIQTIRREFMQEQQYQIVLDQLGKAIEEYRRHFHPDPTPSLPIGNQFLMHLLKNRYQTNVCITVNITQTETGEFEEYPADERLATFDPSDRKWVAMAIAHQQQYGEPAAIVNAVDSDWLPIQPVLAEYGIQVEQICPA